LHGCASSLKDTDRLEQFILHIGLEQEGPHRGEVVLGLIFFGQTIAQFGCVHIMLHAFASKPVHFVTHTGGAQLGVQT